jgi:type IV secretory pathway VirB9-like protein
MRLAPLVTLVALCTASVSSAQTSRDVTFNERSVIQVNAKLRFTTMIILPEGEQILDFVCGDKDFWVVSGAENLAYVKPAKAGAQTNLNLVTGSGRVYAFLLTEGTAEPDLKLYVVADDSATRSAGAPRFVPAAQVDDARRQAEETRQEALATKAAAAKALEEGMNHFRATYPTTLRFPYLFKAHEKPFNVSAIFHDGTFTYIRADTQELPSLYEIRDGAPNLVNFQVENGLYVVPKVMERGYVAIGSHRFTFESK